MTVRTNNQRIRGVAYGHVDAADPMQQVRSPKAPSMVARVLFSCGYKTGKLENWRGKWITGPVFDRDTGESRGIRWVRPKVGGGYEVVSKEPA